ncbi:heavy-metal-associated domain-containing protein, partial [Aeromonas caviae]
MTIELTVTGMSCGGCAASLQKALLAQPAVRTATVDFASRQAVIESELSKA